MTGKWLVSVTLIAVVAAGCAADQEQQTTAFVTAGTSGTVPTTQLATTTKTVTVHLPTAGEVTTVAELDSATGGLAIDSAGNLYVADIGPAPGRLGTRVFRVSVGGDTELFADDRLLLGASGNTFGSDGSLLQAALTAGRIARITPDGAIDVFAEDKIIGPVGVVSGPEGELFVADCRADAVWEVDTSGRVTQLASSPLFSCPNGIARDDQGTLYVANFSDGKVLAVGADGEVSELVELPGRNNGHVVYAGSGVLLVVARGVHQIFAVALDGTSEVFAGTGEPGSVDGPAAEASFALPNAIALGPDGAVYVNQSADASKNHPTVVRRIEMVSDG